MDAETLHTRLTEMQARLEHPLEHMRPVEFELKDPLPSETRVKKVGVITRAKFDILKEFYDWLMVAPENCVMRCIGWIEEDGEGQPVVTTKPKKASKPEKGAHGKFWQEMFLEGIIGRADFQQWTGVQPGLEGWEKTVRALFEKDSLTFVSPEMLLKWLREQAGSDRLKGLLKAIEDIAKTGEPDFPPDQYFSPFDLGARKPAQPSDNQFLEENQLP
jgi:hypothetical protein